MKLLPWIALTAIVATGTFKSNAAPIACFNTNSTNRTPVKIIKQPSSVSVVQTAPVRFWVEVSGSAPLHYEWFQNNRALAGETRFEMVLSNAQPANAGLYRVEISNPVNKVVSKTVSLIVKTPPQGEIKLQGGAGLVVPHISARADGTTWLAWYAPSATNYSLRLQHLDIAGGRLLGSNGVPASAVDSDSWVMDYDLTTDTNGNAVLFYSNTTDFVLRAQQFDPQGTPRWGASGVTLSTPGAQAYAPSVLQSSNGDLVIAWEETQDTNGAATSYLRVMRMQSTGELAWNTPCTVEPAPGNSFGLSQIAPGGDGSVFLVWVENAGVDYPGDVYAQRIDMTGEAVWSQPLKVNGTNQLPYATQPVVVADGVGGICLAWSSLEDADWFKGRVQHVDQDGLFLWAEDGVLVSTSTNTMQLPSAITCMPAANRVVVAWEETDFDQNLIGISAQSFDAQATPLWAATGLVVVKAGPQAAYATALRPTDTGTGLFYVQQQTGFDQLTADVAFLPAQPGAKPIQTTLSRVASDITDPVVSDLVFGGYWLAWADSRGGIFGAFWSANSAH